MSNHKTIIDSEAVCSFLKDNFSNTISKPDSIVGGEGSQAFSFVQNGKGYVIRINKHHTLGFKKDEYAFLNFSKYGVPIPEIIQIGKIDSQYRYCISVRAEGETLNSMPAEYSLQLVPAIFDQLEKIHAVDVCNTTGYGKWDEDGVGGSGTWEERLLNVDEYVKASSEKPSLFETSFLEKEVWDKLLNRMASLFKFCPREKYLVHGDYGFGNILANEMTITGIIDWEASMYGDFLFDVAWLNFWSRKIDFVKSYKERYESRDVQISDCDERILCYMIYIGLRTLSFYAYSNQEEKYIKLKERINSLI